MKTVRIYCDDVTVGDDITVWYHNEHGGGFGQGGRLVEWTVMDHITIESPVGEIHHFFFDEDIDYVTAEVPHEAHECLEYGANGEHCSGPVDLVWAGGNRSWPRCEYHGEERMRRYDESIKDSDIAPSWLDPSYAGERWDDE